MTIRMEFTSAIPGDVPGIANVPLEFTVNGLEYAGTVRMQCVDGRWQGHGPTPAHWIEAKLLAQLTHSDEGYSLEELISAVEKAARIACLRSLHARITVTLTAYNMATNTNADFDAWAAYVKRHIDAAVGFHVCVEQHHFANGPDSDTISGATDAQTETLRAWLSHTGWNAWLAKGGI